MANRLANATSPYLLQHAENPVDWWEWGPEAFAEAKRRDTPILLSVGYAACHWCHVMAHESFEDEDTASYLNEHFVSVKVDREERPDVDAVYMQATTAMTGHGGWPMTCVLDHEGVPFFAGTYFPDQPRHGQPGFRQVLQALSQVWTSQPEEVQRVAGSIRDHLRGAVVPAGEEPVDAEVLDQAVETFGAEFDPANGGFGTAPKFPPSMVLEFLLRYAARVTISTGSIQRSTGSGVRASGMLDRTLDAMARGGLYDQLAGGFARYSVDRGWVVPHFEKMLYDNAQLVGLYARRGGDLGLRIARETADFLLAELGTAEGAFASALDADSPDASGHSREGAYYAWTPAELDAVLGGDAAWAARLLTVTDAGTFEEGASTLQLRTDPDDAERWAVRAAAAARRALGACPAGARRQGGRGVERARGLRTGRRRAAPRRARVRRGGGPLRVVPLGRALGPFDRLRAGDRPPAPGLPRRRRRRARRGAGGLRLPRHGVRRPRGRDRRPGLAGARPHPARRRGGAVRGRRRRVLRHRRRRRGARVPAAGPGRQRQPVRACRRWRTRCSATRRSPAPASTGRWRRVR